MLLLVAYSLAFSVVIVIPVFWTAQAGLALLLTYALAYYLRRDALLLLPASPVRLRVEEGSATVSTRGGGEFTGVIAGDSLVSAVLIILNFSQLEAGRGRSVVIFPDSMDHEDLRTLRVLLKWSK